MFRGAAGNSRCHRAKILSAAQLATESAGGTAQGKISLCNLDGTRGVLRLGGEELIPFLQGLLTNDVSGLGKADSEPVYAALLNAQGRHLHEMFLSRAAGSAPVILADVDKAALPDLKRKLLMYKLRSAVDIADVSDEYSVWARFGDSSQPDGGWRNDPRLAVLGQRAILSKDGSGLAGEAGEQVDPSEHARWRYEHGVAEGDIEMPSGHAMPLEYNLDALNGVSYTKGCYVGQELIARTHNRGVVRKRLMPFTVLEGSGKAPEPGSGVQRAEGGADVGKVRAAAAGVGLAHLRLKQGLLAATNGEPLNAGDAVLRPGRPAWWPEIWGHEEEET